MSASDHLGPQFGYSRPVVGQVAVTHPDGTTTSHHTDLVGYGLNAPSLRHPHDVPTAMYHGTSAELNPGDHVEPGHPGNFARRMTHVYMTEQAHADDSYKGARGYGRNVYEVKPTGWYGHRRDARGPEWATSDPLQVVRKVDPELEARG